MKKMLIAVAVVLGAIYFLPEDTGAPQGTSKRDAETYRLVHAIGDTERINAVGLSKSECEMRRDDAKIVAVSIGAGGSITCLPESLFRN